MKNKLTLFSILLLAFVCCISGCKKSDDDAGSFTWNYKGVEYIAKYTLARVTDDLGYNIVGGLQNSALAPGSGPRFNVRPFQKGLFVLGPGENPFQFIDTDGNSLSGSGIITITSTANKKLSANFVLEVITVAGKHTLRGDIKNISIRP